MVTHNGNEFIVLNRLGKQCSNVLDRESAFGKLIELRQTDHDVKPVYRDKKGNASIFTRDANIQIKEY